MPSPTLSNRLFTAIALPSIEPIKSSISHSIGMLTGNTSMTSSSSTTNKSKRIMDRVWEKRKKKLQKATNLILSRFETESMKFDCIELYIRKAGSFNESEDNAQKEVHIALRGIAHTVVVLKSGSSAFLLDRVVEGIRLTELQMDEETQCIEACARFKPD